MKRIALALAILGGVIVGLSADSFAAGECPVCDGAASDQYFIKTGYQFTRGILNTSLCWTELFNQPGQEMKAGGNLLIGMGKGVGHTFLRLVEGAGEIITCPMPRAEDGKYTQIAQDCSLGVMGFTDR